MDTQRQLNILKRAATDPPKLNDEEIVALMKSLPLPLCYFSAVQEAVRQGKWRNARNPVGYIRTVAERQAPRIGLADDPAEKIHLNVPSIDGQRLSHDQYLDYLSYDGPTKQNGIWSAGCPDFGCDDDECTPEGVALSAHERLFGRLPEEFLCIEYLEGVESEFIDWEKIGVAAGLEATEIDVLRCRAAGISRERAIKLEEPRNRKRLQAALASV